MQLIQKKYPLVTTTAEGYFGATQHNGRISQA